jgi:hypothetical protein
MAHFEKPIDEPLAHLGAERIHPFRPVNRNNSDVAPLLEKNMVRHMCFFLDRNYLLSSQK